MIRYTIAAYGAAKENFDMANANRLRSLFLLVVGAVFGGVLAPECDHSTALVQAQNPQVTSATMQADLAHLKEIVPPASHPHGGCRHVHC
jgi:hypothetical protein